MFPANLRWRTLHSLYSRIPIPILRWAIRQARRNPARIEAYLKSADTAVAHLISRRFALTAMQIFGPGERYLLAGYPPFLAELVRFLHARPGFDVKSFRVDVMSGGEGFPSGWRTFMESGLRPGARLVSAYGASDLEVGIASETPCSKALLGILLDSPTLRKEILGTEREPVFLGQYNPSGDYIRSTRNAAGQNEVEVTTLNPHSVSPRVTFCVGDEGGVLDCEATFARLRALGVDAPAERLALPILFIFGRCDGTVSIDGANIYPDTVASALLEHPLAAATIRTFKMGVTHTPAGTARLKFLLQAVKGIPPSEGLTLECKGAIVQKLLTVNTDFRESYKDNPASADPIVEIVGFESEHLASNPQKVKNSYFL